MDCIKTRLACITEPGYSPGIDHPYSLFKNYFDRLKISQVFGGFSPESDIRELK